MFGCTRFDHYLHGREKITAITDHKPLETILAKSINSAPNRLERMMLRLQKYHLNIVYKKGTQMYISDHLSRSALPNGRTQKKEIDDYEVFTIHAEELLMKEIEGTDPNIFHNMTDATLQKVVTATSKDGNLMTLAETIANGWPEDKTQVPPNVRDYWPYRDELAVQDGIIYRGTRVLIPTAMRPQMLEKTHSAHLGAEGCMRLARDTLYWPSIHHDIKYLCDNCSICQEAKPDQPRETMQSQHIPKRRWQIVGTDLFNVKKDVYLVVVDNLTKYWDLEQLNGTDAESTILQMKKIFARQGVPEVVISDNVPQYASKEFKEFQRVGTFITIPLHHTIQKETVQRKLQSNKLRGYSR